MLAGTALSRILECAKEMMAKTVGWQNPFGDRKAAERIIDTLCGV